MRILAASLLLLAMAVTAAPAAATPADDHTVELALRAAILGRADLVRDLAADATLQGADLPRAERLGGNLSQLALAVDRPIPNIPQWRHEIPRRERDVYTNAVLRLVRRANPWERFLEARRDRKYQRTRRFYNSVLLPFAYIAQGQFLAAITLPIAAAEDAVVRRRMLDPEQRQELREATTIAAAMPGNDVVMARTEGVRTNWPARRETLAKLHASTNARGAVETGRYVSAQFWIERLTALRGSAPRGDKAFRQYVDVTATLNGTRRESVAVATGDDMMGSAEFIDYGQVLRGFLDPARSGEFSAMVSTFSVEHPNSRAIPAMEAAEAAHARHAGESMLAVTYLDQISRRHAGTPWGDRAMTLMGRAPFGAEATLAEAVAAIDARRRDFILAARLPRPANRSHSAEESRLWRLTFFARARALFITDTLARALFFPLMPPFPRDELVDAAGRVDPAFFETPRGRQWTARVARAQSIERRHEDAMRSYEAIGDTAAARKQRHRAARLLERHGDDATMPATSVQAFERLLNAYPEYRRRARVEGKLTKARLEREARATATREELRRWPAVLDALALPGGSALVDGRRGNGEISRDGLYILSGDRIVYTDRASGQRIELPAPNSRAALAHLEAGRRLGSTREELRRPLPRKRIPLAVEAGAFPGVELAPQLVPLEPDPKRRKMYE